jgi:ABC-type polysaccharide/polyol phosphate transport system ATPase subunit
MVLDVLKDIDLVIERGEKVAFVGEKWRRKTTLSRVIMCELEYEWAS